MNSTTYNNIYKDLKGLEYLGFSLESRSDSDGKQIVISLESDRVLVVQGFGLELYKDMELTAKAGFKLSDMKFSKQKQNQSKQVVAVMFENQETAGSIHVYGRDLLITGSVS